MSLMESLRGVMEGAAAGLSKGHLAQAAAAQGASNTHIQAMKRRARCPQGTPEQLAAARKYQDARLRGDIPVVLSLLSPSIKFLSQRDGPHAGIEAFAAYLRSTPVEGTWGRPYIDEASGLIRVDGKVKWAKVIPITVKGIFLFGPDGKVEESFVGKA
jgi:hypothetical protein